MTSIIGSQGGVFLATAMAAVSGGKTGEKKKKRVRFADVVDPTGDNEEFRRPHSTNLRKINNNNNRRLMPANRAALYNGILRDRVIHRVTYSY